MIHCFNANDRNYGRIRLKKELSKAGIAVSEYRISRILKENQLVAKGGRPRTAKKRKIPEKQYVEENLLKDKFSVTEANYLWCSDITEIEYKHGKLYLCCIIDVATRRIVGWSIERNQRQSLVQAAFQMAVGRNPKRPKGAIYHSDRGCQYTAKKTKEMVERAGFRKSMSRPGTPNDNQPIESFWRTLKTEGVCPKFCVNTAGQCKIEPKYFKAGAASAVAALSTKQQQSEGMSRAEALASVYLDP